MFIQLIDSLDRNIITVNFTTVKYFTNSKIVFLDGSEFHVIEDDNTIRELIMNTNQLQILSSRDLK